MLDIFDKVYSIMMTRRNDIDVLIHVKYDVLTYFIFKAIDHITNTFNQDQLISLALHLMRRSTSEILFEYVLSKIPHNIISNEDIERFRYTKPNELDRYKSFLDEDV